MVRYRVFKNPDGSVRILIPNMRRWNPMREAAEVYAQRVCDEDMQKGASLLGLPFMDVDAAELPTSRSTRHKWRMRERMGRQVVEVDLTIPDPPGRVP